MSDYNNWQLEALREECNKREIVISSKDGVKTLASKLRTHDVNKVVEETDKAQVDVHDTQPGEFEDDKSMQNLSDSLDKLKLASDLNLKNEGKIPRGSEKVNSSQRENTSGTLNFHERMELLHFERDLEREREEREIRREERRQRARFEERAFEVELERERVKTSSVFEHSGKFVKVREMRETEDIDDYFRIFEMTAKTQKIPRSEWLGSLAPRLSEKAKSIFLEISGVDACDYDKSKEIILKSYQLNVDHYRFRFRHAEKKLDEDFGQWAHRTRRYLDRWMSVAKATGDPEKILDQIVIEHLLSNVGPELCVWLKERKPATAEELAMLANEYVQIRKSPIIDEKFGKKRKYDKTKVTCFVCQEKGHYSYECKSRNAAHEGHLGISSTPGNKYYDRMSIKAQLSGQTIDMVIDSGCCRTLVHKKFVGKNHYTGELMTVLMANGDRIKVPLAWVEIKSRHGLHRELVGVMHNLPVDCLLGRSSFGLSLTKEDLLKQWDQCIEYPCKSGDATNGQAFVLTRRQAALQNAQTLLDQRIDEQNQMAVKKLHWDDIKDNSELVDDYNLKMLFESKFNVKECKDNDMPDKECKVPPESIIEKRNILNRNRSQLIQDQTEDVTLSNLNVSDIAPMGKKGIFRLVPPLQLVWVVADLGALLDFSTICDQLQL